jgi:hypothetical protein
VEVHDSSGGRPSAIEGGVHARLFEWLCSPDRAPFEIDDRELVGI